jgi:hypothetical protein
METRDFFKKRMAQALLVFILAVTNPMSTRATTVRPLDLPELVQRAEVIADVTVTATTSFLVSPAGGKAIQTRVTFTLNSAPLKGQVTSPFALNFLGGTVGTHRMEVPGMPKFQVGDRLILFSINGTNPLAIMDIDVSDIYYLTSDDIAGAQALYGAPANSAPNNPHPPLGPNRNGQAELVWQDTITGARSIWVVHDAVPSFVINLPMIPIEWKIAAAADFLGPES